MRPLSTGRAAVRQSGQNKAAGRTVQIPERTEEILTERTYVAIDLKSFYASVACVELGRDPLTTNLVVADESRTEKTICLAVSPSLKQYGVPGRARLFEVHEIVDDVNRRRLRMSGRTALAGGSTDDRELRSHPELAVEFIAAPPQMARYLEVSADIYKVYLQYFAPEDMHVYSVDEVFIDITDYLETYRLGPEALVRKLILEVLEKTGVTATAGIGTNLYLCKVALDVEAKKIPPDENGVRIASLDEMSYRRQLWTHRPLTDFWRIGRGTAGRLDRLGVETMGDLARASLQAEDQLYRLFGRNAELLIDHAWGYEPCTMADIKAYRPANHSISSGQVLQRPYPYDQARLVAGEMADELAMDLTEKQLVTDQVVLTVGYDAENLRDPARAHRYEGPVKNDYYGRPVPKHAHGSEKLPVPTAGRTAIHDAVLRIFDRAVDPDLLVRRLTVAAGRVLSRKEAEEAPRQMDFFSDGGAEGQGQQRDRRDQALQEAAAVLRERYGKGVLFHACDLQEGATALERNRQIGGHRA